MNRFVALALTAVVAAVAASTSGAAARTDRYACYPAQFSAFQPQRLTVTDDVTAVRQSLLAELPERVCAPAGDGATTADALSYQACYVVRVATPVQRDVRVRDEFGLQTLRVLNPVSVCVPAARIDAGPPRDPLRLDTYVCYAVKPAATLGSRKITVGDAFARADETVAGPARLCAPTAPYRPSMTCYAIGSGVKGVTVVIRNGLGYLKAALGPRDQLCTVATRV